MSIFSLQPTNIKNIFTGFRSNQIIKIINYLKKYFFLPKHKTKILFNKKNERKTFFGIIMNPESENFTELPKTGDDSGFGVNLLSMVEGYAGHN